MRVCASCGTRDPDDPYSREREVIRLRDLPASHWLRVPRVAYEHLLSAESCGPVIPRESGRYSHVDCWLLPCGRVYTHMILDAKMTKRHATT